MLVFDLVVIGGGAAGFYGAIHAAGQNPALKVLILEKSTKLLSKVRISGGGRCNVTHACFDRIKFAHHYPRGEKPLRRVFQHHDSKQTVDWFSARAVELKAEPDGRMFPVSDSSETIVDCFLTEAQRLGIKIETSHNVESVMPTAGKFQIITESGSRYETARVLIAIGGSPKTDAYSFIGKLGHHILKPIPSLFTFNDRAKKFADLMGIAVPNAEVRIATTKFKQQGPLLITHWGLSGPAVIKLSAWAAEYLHSQQYRFTALVSWIGPMAEESLRALLLEQKHIRARQKICNNPLYGLPQRLWLRLCLLSEIPEEKIWAEISLKQLNRLLENMLKCPFNIHGKTTFKEEFVTCGGVDLGDINLETMESKLVKGIFFAGEVLNIDGETGGFNFQAAWSTAFLAAKSAILKKM